MEQSQRQSQNTKQRSLSGTKHVEASERKSRSKRANSRTQVDIRTDNGRQKATFGMAQRQDRSLKKKVKLQ